jgi:hypothetical protein
MNKSNTKTSQSNSAFPRVSHCRGEESEDGIITEKVLSRVLSNPKCQAYFQTLDLDVNEGAPNKKWGQVMESDMMKALEESSKKP